MLPDAASNMCSRSGGRASVLALNRDKAAMRDSACYISTYITFFFGHAAKDFTACEEWHRGGEQSDTARPCYTN